MAFRNAGRRTDWHELVLVSTLRFVFNTFSELSNVRVDVAPEMDKGA